MAKRTIVTSKMITPKVDPALLAAVVDKEAAESEAVQPVPPPAESPVADTEEKSPIDDSPQAIPLTVIRVCAARALEMRGDLETASRIRANSQEAADLEAGREALRRIGRKDLADSL